jgi:hypothetical protein
MAATAKLTPEKAAAAVKEALKKNGAVLTESRTEDGAVVEVNVSFQVGSGGPLTPLKAFSRLKTITIVDKNNLLDRWSDLSPLMALLIEEIVSNPGMIAGNAIILRQMPALKTINGKTEKEVLTALK